MVRFNDTFSHKLQPLTQLLSFLGYWANSPTWAPHNAFDGKPYTSWGNDPDKGFTIGMLVPIRSAFIFNRTTLSLTLVFFLIPKVTIFLFRKLCSASS
jgi:hypothetical protein